MENSLKEEFGYGTTVRLQGNAPSGNKWSKVTGIPEGTEGIVVGTLGNIMRVKITKTAAETQCLSYRTGAVISTGKDGWVPRIDELNP